MTGPSRSTSRPWTRARPPGSSKNSSRRKRCSSFRKRWCGCERPMSRNRLQHQLRPRRRRHRQRNKFMRTGEVSNLNQASTKIASSKSGVVAPKRKSRESSTSSFDEVLQKRTTPKKEESKRTENTEPKKAERAGKRTTASKTRAKKPA